MKNQFNAGTLRFLENWEFILRDKYTNEIISKSEVCNSIVNNGLERIARLINGNSGTYFRAIAIGTGTDVVTISDTALQTEYDRSDATLEYESSYKAKFTYTFSFSSGTSEAITEAGIFDSDVVLGSVMLARTTFSAKNVTASTTLEVIATITTARV